MALSEDQRALLRLLIAGDTYARVGEVLGTSADAVRTRAHEAARALERETEPEMPLEAVADRLRALDGSPSEEAAAAPAAPRHRDRRRLALWAVAGGGVLVLVVVVLIAGVGGGDGNRETTTAGGGQEEVVPVTLRPVGSSGASGGISIIRIGDQPAVDLDIRGLTPTQKGQTYVLWFVGSGGRSLPIAFQAVGANGRIGGRTAIASAAAGLLPSFESAELTLTRQSEAAAAVNQAARSGTLPQRVGTSVMRGTLR